MRISDDVRQSRVDARCLFSATHVAALLDGACDHFASASDLPFDLVQESRRRSPVPESLESHITEFVGRGTPQTELVTFAMPVIGSSLFLDAYPPGAHLFDPVEVFEGLYSDMLNRAFSNEPMPLGGLITAELCLNGSSIDQAIQRFGGLITAEMCLNGSSIDQAIQRFGILAKQVFHRRRGVRIPFLPSLLRRWIAHGLRYFFPFPQLAQLIDILLYYVVRPKQGLGNVPLWEVGRAASAAPGFFPPKHIYDVGSFQDAGPLVDPTLSALCEVTALFPLLEEPDFVVSIGTGESQPSNAAATEDLCGVLGNGAVPRLGRLFWEKMGDKKGLDAVFGRRACRKRKSACADTSPRKRRAVV
ncbi:hypothetical protein HYQ46_004447 [Verticillium longisporum]|nr:hypothetical protein HYQ46_004447 [Verticillium longisporum]